MEVKKQVESALTAIVKEIGKMESGKPIKAQSSAFYAEIVAYGLVKNLI
jgi:hypothetical protein